MNLFSLVPLHPAFFVIAVVTAFVAAFYDIRWRRIPNWLVLTALVVGLGACTWLGGLNGLLRGAGGFGIALLLYFPLYLARGMGAGDVKLMAAMGVCLGAKNWLILALMAACISSAAGLVIATSKGRFRSTLMNVGLIVSELAAFRSPRLANEELDVKSSKAIRFPHGVAVAIGTVALIALTVLNN